MKQVKVKKIKKIPKYSGGGLAGLSDKSGLAPGKISQPQAITEYKALQMSNVLNKNFGSQSMPSFNGISALNTGAGVAAVAAQPIATGLGIEQGTAGKIGSTIGKAVGLIDPTAGLVIEAISPFLGGIGGNDYSKITTTNDATTATTEKSGIIGKIFGKNTNKLHREANQYQNSLVATELTSNLLAEWANDPRNQGIVSTLKEGGLVPGEHYASRNEVEVDSDGNNAVRYAWDPKGKDTYHVYTNPDGSSAEGNMIFNEEGVKRPNGMKYSDTAEKIIKNIKDPKLRKISLNKLAAEQEVEKEKEGKTNNGIPAYGGGDDGKSGKWSDRVRNYIESVIEPAVVDYVHRATYDPYGFSGNEFIPAEDRITGRAISDAYQSYADPNLGASMDSGFMYADWTKGGKTNTAINKAVEQPVEKQTSDLTQEPVSTAYSTTTTSEKPVTKPVYTSSSAATRINPYGYNKNMSEFAHWDKEKNDYTQEYKDWVNSLTEKDIKDIYNGVYGDMSTYLGKNKGYVPTLAEAKRLMTDRKYGDWHKMAAAVKEKMTEFTPDFSWWYEKDKLKPGEKVAIKHGDPIVIDEKVIEDPLPSKQKKSFDWNKFGDRLYKAASILTPLFDREKAETTRLRRPTWHGIPVAADALNELQDAQLGYALANYNTAQGGYTAGQQLAARGAAASNLARQRAAIHQWQTEQQNKNIAQNIASLNAHSNVLSEIENKETDINDANRAAAKKINRQNRSQAFKNIGQILRDRKQYDRDLIKTEILKPMIEAVYENSDIVIPMLNKQIKKKSTKKSKVE